MVDVGTLVKPAFTDDGAPMLTALIAGKCGDDDAGCTATCRRLVGRGYGNAEAAVVRGEAAKRCKRTDSRERRGRGAR